MSRAINQETGWRDALSNGGLARIAIVWLGVWLNAADSLVTATLMPSVGADLGGHAWFSWTIAGFMVGAILAGASAGRLSEVVGLRVATALAGAIFAAGCISSAAAPNMAMFLAGRLIQGLGSGWISGFAMVAMASLFPERHLGRIFASVAGVWGVATILGPLVGGVFANGGDWRWVFWLFAAQAMIFAVAAPFLLNAHLKSADAPGVPWRQLAILGAGVTAIGLADIAGTALAAAALIATGLLIIGWVVAIDGRARTPLLPNRAGDVRTAVGAGYLMLFATTAASMPLTVYGPAILQQLRGLTPLEAGYTIAAEAVMWTLVAFTVAGIHPPRDIGRIRFGGFAIFVGVALQLLVMRDAQIVPVAIAAGLMGAGFGASTALISRRVLSHLTAADRAVGSSALMAVRQVGGAVGAAIGGVAANLSGFGAGLNDASARGAAIWSFAAMLPLAAVGVWAAWQLTRAPSPAR